MTTALKNLFRNYHPEGKLAQAMEKLNVERLEGDRMKRAITVHCVAKEYADAEDVEQLEEGIREAYALESVSLKIRYEVESITDEYLTILCKDIRAAHPVINGFLEDAKFERADGSLLITLAHGGADILQSLAADQIISRRIGEDFGRAVAVRFEEAEQDTAAIEEELARETPNEPKAAAPEKKKSERKTERSDKSEKTSYRKKTYTLAPGEEVVYGKPLAEEFTPMRDVDMNFVGVTVRGTVFAVNHREIAARDLTIVSFDITDLTGSIRVSRALQKEKAQPLVDGIQVGEAYIVQGQPVYNRFEQEMTLSVNAVVKTKLPQRTDKAEKKRVELHMHTNMSAMDGMTPAGDLIKRAAKWGHTAIAVTDHGVAQAYPDAAKAMKKTGIKVLYGIEGYDLNDLIDANVVFGKDPGDARLDGSFVAFDVETTGLSSESDVIIQIAATKVVNGEAGESYEAFVNPGRPIPAKITELTGIRDSDVRDAGTIEEVLPGFLEFAGDEILVAHNAPFDAKFLKAACEKCGIQRDFCFFDTLELSRALLPNQQKHNLKAVAEGLGAGGFRHHRADEDAGILAEILIRLNSMLKERGIEYVRDVNPRITEELRKETEEHGEHGHIIIIAKNLVGLRNLYELISLSQLKHYKRKPRILRTELEKLREGLIVGSACEQGELFQAIIKGRPWKTLCKIAEYFDFLEIQPLGNNEFMVRNGTAASDETLREYNRTIVRLGKAVNRPVCATGDVHFLDPEDSQFRAILMAGQGFSDADEQAPLYLKTTDEMLEEFSYLGTNTAYEVVVENTNKIADMCENIQPVPDGVFPPSIPGSAEELQQIVYNRAYQVYGNPLPDIIRERIEAELNPIINHGFDVMYMIAQKLIAKSNAAGYLVGSRGSVGSSVVAYFAGITEVNAYPPHYRCEHCLHSDFDVPKEYSFGIDMPDKDCPICGHKYRKDGCDIMFATFLGFKADKQPDIDLNFSGEYQANAHRDTIELFGADHVFRAGTIGTLAEKTAYGFVRKYLEERGRQVSKVEIDRLTLGCTGVRRTTGQHPGGLVVIPSDHSVYDFCPVQHPADDPNTDIITTHFDFHAIHDTVLKLDELGHDDPTMIKVLGDLTGIDMLNIPFDDPDTMSIFLSSKVLGYENDDLIGKVGTVAVPEFGTKFTRGMLVETKPKTFAGLVRIAGLSHGTDVWLGNAQKFISEGKTDLDHCIACRDDVTAYLMSCGIEPSKSFKISETVRKGKGLEADWIPMMKEHGVPDWYIESANTVKYLFPRAHATAYVMMAFRIAYCKVHHPMAFYAAYFTIRATGFDPKTALQGKEAIQDKYWNIYERIEKREQVAPAEKDTMQNLEVCYEMALRGIGFLRPDIYKSDAEKFIAEGNNLRIPFTAMGGFGAQAARDICAEREHGKFTSVEDMTMRCPKVSKGCVALLEECGALEDIPKTEQLSIFG